MQDKRLVQEYWEERARRQANSPTATTNDVHMRTLEINTIIETCRELNVGSGRAIDLGCGDGYSTLSVADKIEGLSFLGIDYSENMINSAQQRLNAIPELQHRVKFVVGDATKIGKMCAGQKFDLIISDRMLINLGSVDIQFDTIAQIGDLLRSGGYYLAIENFFDGQELMNEARRKMGLSEIPIRWHNRFFRREEFVQCVERHFELLEFKEFASSYYFATRVIYARMCQILGEEPDYNHPIHQLAGDLPWIGEFSPIKLAVLRKSSVLER